MYVADVILFSIVWAIPFGKEDVDGMIKPAEMILDDYDNFNLVIPRWFEDLLKGLIMNTCEKIQKNKNFKYRIRK